MASAALGDELSCSICLNLHTEPVSLRCGHHFCQDCIVTALDTQGESGVYSCPECKEEFAERPTLEKNRKLCNIAETFQSTDQEKIEVLCMYCDLPERAVKMCLQCESSFCERHLLKHRKLVGHILVEPTVTLEDRKCSIHKEILKYYCSEDMVSVCVSCCLAGQHRGHQVQFLNEALEKKKKKLRKLTEKLDADVQETDKSIHNLSTYRKEEKAKAAAIAQKVNGLFGDIRRQLDVLEWKVLCEVFKQEKQVVKSVSRLIQQLEIQKSEISTKIDQIKNLCDIADAFTFLEKEQETDDLNPGRCEIISDMRDAGCIDETPILQMLHRGLILFADGLTDLKIKREFSVMEKADILLDINTAHNNIILSEDLRSASYTDKSQKRPNCPERFMCCQVISTQSFSSGKHYWEVDVSQAKKWLIGVAAKSLGRKQVGKETYIGYNAKSWGLYENHFFKACHNNIHKIKEKKSPVEAIGIYINYEAGLLSFYEICEQNRHLHTFTATFSEPLHAAFYVFPGSCIKIIN
ncbi:E3 ubiquitin/ISG15 ligase TRIM25-like [Aquarana catesbeiana]|uniref:E3 ubiquitin/ISG15 ligase TRIM25-like n=1 Tax=Aquarana catesbeiana TaxID=8400 RepID=UPI003CC9E229